MQYSTIFTLFALAATTLAAPASNIDLAPRACSYATGNYLSVCQQGDTLFCTGNVNICPAGSSEGFDATATAANEEACKGLSLGEGCVQTKACDC